ncbi:hypothetical protein PPROV_000245200 [Pycnococcus provasolii]|uniref:Alpha-SNAP n=1 Tax=Pycnococcus provasolii TaxID=41880 RepID=A0A830HF23_9CHLO|nr:hypothetical protein PPROV_000245200 [Pycnococcus provasolii]|mmetsp:Transcript_14740/g.39058  ORF Transcript_14740/g.39058 Transcript_14740/m.39058 type:complete len:290 (-) Transcript_14740:1598-2467(-)
MADASKARELVAKAEKKLAGWSLFGNKYEDALELLEKASANLKLAKAWSEAGECFLKIAQVQQKLDSAHEVASAYVDASNAFKKTSQPKSEECLRLAVKAYTDMGRLGMAAKYLRELGENAEGRGEKETAVDLLSQAGDLFDGEEQKSEANKAMLKVASLRADLGAYAEAMEGFETVSKRSVDNNLLKYSVKTYLLQSSICAICLSFDKNEPEYVERVLEKYEDIDPSFGGSREHKFLQDLQKARVEGDVDAFTAVVQEFDAMSRLDTWKTNLLLTAKRKLEADEDDLT